MASLLQVILVFVIVCVAILFVVNRVFDLTMPEDRNYEEYGLRVSDEELQCYQFCDGVYLYQHSTAFRTMLCECKEGMKK